VVGASWRSNFENRSIFYEAVKLGGLFLYHPVDLSAVFIGILNNTSLLCLYYCDFRCCQWSL